MLEANSSNSSVSSEGSATGCSGFCSVGIFKIASKLSSDASVSRYALTDIAQRITVGQFFSLSSIHFSFRPAAGAGQCRQRVSRDGGIARQFRSDFEKCRRSKSPEHPVALPSLETLEFDRVSFQHQSASSPALSEISFRVARGETIAVCRPVGCGQDVFGEIAGSASTAQRVAISFITERRKIRWQLKICVNELDS